MTRDEKQALRRRWEASDKTAAELSDSVAHGRYALVVVAGTLLLNGLFYGVVGGSAASLALCLVLAAAMLGLFFWSGQRPLAALATGTSAFVVLRIITALVSPLTMALGLLTKLLILGAMVGGIGAELRFRKRERERARKSQIRATDLSAG